MKICPKCNAEHDKNGTFCSRTCANSRGVRPESFKEKVRLKLQKPRIESICEECGNAFVQKKPTNSSKCCSMRCNRIRVGKLQTGKSVSNEVREKMSISRKAMFANGYNVTGGKTQWIEYKNIKVQGSYEFRTCIILDKWKESGFIRDWEYTNDRITYTNLVGATATYLLDFKVNLNDGDFVYIETKGFIRENDELKWEACRAQNFNIVIWFENNICEAENASDQRSITSILA